MSDEPTPPDRQEQAPRAPDSPPAPSAPRQEPPLDWRLAAIIGVAILLLVAVYVNRKYYGKDRTTAADNTLDRAPGDKQPGQKPPPRRISFPEQYKMITRLREMQTMETVLTSGDRVFMVARPVMPVRDPKDPKKVTGIRTGTLFDITKMLDGVEPRMLHRRQAFNDPKFPVFQDTFAAIGLVPQIEMDLKDAAQVELAEISDRARVIGIQVGDDARAYPVKLANHHEVINDVVGGRPVVIAWSALADSASAMERSLDASTTLTFGSAGLIYQGAIVLYDTASASLWSAATRTCVAGERTGATLKPIQTFLTSWRSWKAMRPSGKAFVGTKPALPINYEVNPALPPSDPAKPASQYYRNQVVLYPVYGYPLEKTPMRPKHPVFGVTGPDGKSFKAYALGIVRAVDAADAPKLKGPIEDTIGGKKVVLEYNRDANILSAKTADGKALPVEWMRWIYWAGLHPTTEVWQEDKFTPPFAKPVKSPEGAPEDSPAQSRTQQAPTK